MKLLIVTGLVLLLSTGSFVASTHVQEGSEVVENDYDPDFEKKNAALWLELDFMFSGREKQITSLEFETFKELAPMARRYSVAEQVEATKTVTSEPNLLKIARFSFEDRCCLRQIVPPGVRGGVGNAYLIGKVILHTTSGDLTIGVGNSGFSIDGNAPGAETEFYSPAGAEFLSMLYCKQTGSPLRTELVSALNGSDFIEHKRRTFRRLDWTKNDSNVQDEE